MEIIDEILNDIRYTDTRIGTASTREFSSGNTLPLCGMPHGNNYLTLMTREDSSFFFHPEDDRPLSLRLTHQPSPWMGDFSHFELSPIFNDGNNLYDRDESIFRPNFLEISYKNGAKIRASMSDTTGVIDFNKIASFKIHAKGLKLTKKDDFLEGYVINYAGCEDKNLKMYIKISLDVNFDLEQSENTYYVKPGSDNFSLKFATSFISRKQTNLNFDKNPQTLEDFLIYSKKAWDKYFDKFVINHDDYRDNFSKFTPYKKTNQVKFFYQAVYRAFLFPMKFYEINEKKNPIYYDTSSKKVKAGRFYTNIGFWDGQKTLFPLLSLVAQDDLEEILEGILNFYNDTGFLPKWLSPDERGLMPGTLVDNVICDSLSKGIGTEFKDDFLKAMVDSAEKESKDNRYGRYQARLYRNLGYIPSSFHESVNQSLDNSLADYSIGKVAEICGEEDLAEKYYSYSRNWENLFDPKTKFLRAKDAKGNFTKDFDPLNWGSPYTEGSAYQNSYNVYHDFPRLIELFGSKANFEKRLDELSNVDSTYNVGAYGYDIHEMVEMHDAHLGQIAISNQPSFHLPYLYNLVGKSYKSELIIKTIMRDFFSYSFRGFPGDEDNGSMAAWFILSAMGIYPLLPGSGFYEMGISFFDKMQVKLSSGNILEIKTKENYPHKNFVNKIEIDGKIQRGKKISHEDFIKAQKITFSLNLLPKEANYEN